MDASEFLFGDFDLRFDGLDVGVLLHADQDRQLLVDGLHDLVHTRNHVVFGGLVAHERQLELLEHLDDFFVVAQFEIVLLLGLGTHFFDGLHVLVDLVVVHQLVESYCVLGDLLALCESQGLHQVVVPVVTLLDDGILCQVVDDWQLDSELRDILEQLVTDGGGFHGLETLEVLHGSSEVSVEFLDLVGDFLVLHLDDGRRRPRGFAFLQLVSVSSQVQVRLVFCLQHVEVLKCRRRLHSQETFSLVE